MYNVHSKQHAPLILYRPQEGEDVCNTVELEEDGAALDNAEEHDDTKYEDEMEEG